MRKYTIKYNGRDLGYGMGLLNNIQKILHFHNIQYIFYGDYSEFIIVYVGNKTIHELGKDLLINNKQGERR